MSPAQARARLRTGALTPIGFLTGASNHTLYCEVDGPDSGVAAVICSWRFWGRSCVSSVSTKPGATALQVMPREASSRAVAFVSPIRPAFAAE